MFLAAAEVIFVGYLAIRYWRVAIPLALGWILLWAAPPFFEGIRDGIATLYGVTISNSVADISALVFVIFFIIGCLLRWWKTSLVMSGVALLIWAT